MIKPIVARSSSFYQSLSLRAGSLVWGLCATILAAKAAICESASERNGARKWRLSPPRQSRKIVAQCPQTSEPAGRLPEPLLLRNVSNNVLHTVFSWLNLFVRRHYLRSVLNPHSLVSGYLQGLAQTDSPLSFDSIVQHCEFGHFKSAFGLSV